MRFAPVIRSVRKVAGIGIALGESQSSLPVPTMANLAACSVLLIAET